MADQSGGAIPGATVVVLNQETGVSNDTVTNETGFYRVSGLPPGRYKVTATLSGFKESVADNVQVSAEEIRGLNVVLAAGRRAGDGDGRGWIASAAHGERRHRRHAGHGRDTAAAADRP